MYIHKCLYVAQLLRSQKVIDFQTYIYDTFIVFITKLRFIIGLDLRDLITEILEELH